MTIEPFGKAGCHGGVGIDRPRTGKWCGVRFARRRLVAVGLGVAMTLPMAAALAAPAASAATAKRASPRTALNAPTATPKSASACSKVSAASVAAIVGQPAPLQPAASSTNHIPATKQSGGVSGTETECVYGKTATVFVLLNVVTSKPLTISLLKKTTLAGSTASDGTIFTSYSGLGVPGFRVTSVAPVRTDQIGGLSGNTEFSATASNSLSVAKLAALANLARKL
jgi:hypothetical protein